MNIEQIGAILSEDTGKSPNGEGRGGIPNFTKTDALHTVGGMDPKAWDYMQFVHVMLDDKFMIVSSACGLRIFNIYRDKIHKELGLCDVQKVCEVALIETRQRPFSDNIRKKLLGTSTRQWYKKYQDIYGLALSIYNELEGEARRHINHKLKEG